MKRQVAITGPTPEFLRWSIAKECPLRSETDIYSVDETEKRLRAVKATGIAIKEGRVFRGVAVGSTPELEEKGFRISEVLDPLGGEAFAMQCCLACEANVERSNGLLAECFGWLSSMDLPEDLLPSIDHASQSADMETFLSTKPIWYGLWAGGQLSGQQLKTVDRLLSEALGHEPSHDLKRLVAAISLCHSANLTLSVEWIPSGFSDGLTWTIAAHCDQCKAPRDPGSGSCPVCRKQGHGHPSIRKKVLGLRPYIDLSVLLGPDNVGTFLKDYRAAKKN